jgi:NAD(P)-dependent dehydrogenase (short-subunit alcohol dehydrogenase family)
MEQLEGRTAVVTGAASGIGRALAAACAGAGMRVAAADIEAGPLAETVGAVRASGGEAIAVTTDVADAASLRDLAATVDATFGGADLLCNNAGVFAGGTLWSEPVADFAWVMGVNFYGILHGIQAFVPGMLERGRPGHVVNTISAAGLFPSAFSAAYTTSKFAALALTECLAGELAAAGAPIGVTALCPGAVATGIATSERNRTDGGAGSAPDAARDLVGRALTDLTARGRPPADVAVMVLDAVRAGRYLQLTHDGYVAALRTRTDELLAGSLPTLPYFD